MAAESSVVTGEGAVGLSSFSTQEAEGQET